MWQLAAIVLAIGILCLQVFGVYDFGTWIPGQTTQPPPDLPTGVVPTTPDGDTVRYDAATIKYTVQNKLTSAAAAAGDTGYMDISKCVDGVWNPLHTTESFEYDAVTDESALIYNYGDQLVMHVGSDVQWTKYENETYDVFLYTTLAPGEPIRLLTPNEVTAEQTSPTYKYKITGVGVDTGQRVSYAGGTSPYWGLGAVQLYPRAGYNDADLYLLSPDGVTNSAVTAINSAAEDDYVGSYAGSGINQTQQGQDGTDYTMVGTTEDFVLQIRAGAINIAYGLPTAAISATGKFEEYRAVICLSTNATGIGSAALYADGWQQVTKGDAYSEKIFYQVIEPLIPSARAKKWVTPSYEITVDATALAASTAYCLKIWVLDWQKPSDVAGGSLSNGTTTAALPSCYGMVTEYGGDSTVHYEGWGVASGLLEGCHIAGDFTTPA